MAYHINPWMILPFALWLALMAFAPLSHGQWWSKHYWKLALCFAAVTTGYYLLALPSAASLTVVHTGRDYFSFIVLIGSLYVVAGGIHLGIDGDGSPAVNTIFLAIAGLAANVLGTTGASVLLIRPWLRLHDRRVGARHVVFFIFVVANIGGGLTPIGDPPLLLGFLKGVPFWWVLQHCLPAWLLSMGWMLGTFYFLERRAPSSAAPLRLRCAGLWNLIFLAVIVTAVFLPEHLFLREGLMLMAASGSYLATPKNIRDKNQFHFAPVIEVAILFFGIFATMMPALDWLAFHAHTVLGPHPSTGFVFWSSGCVSSLLDNAPAYLAFITALSGGFTQVDHAGGSLLAFTQNGSAALAALSVATVFFGALTYIGNGPNLMIKAIAEQQGIRLPSFLGYLFKWAVPILLPLLLLLWLLFFR